MITMDIGVWDVILGVDWIIQYSLITFDFRHMNVRLYKEGSEMVLEGRVQQPIMKLVRGKAIKKFNSHKQKSMAEIQVCSSI